MTKALGAMMKGDNGMLSTKACPSVARWIARIWSLIVIGLLSLFLFAEGSPPISVLYVFFPFGVMMGLIIAWFFEGIGGTITIASITVFYLIHYHQNGTLPSGPFFLITASPSIVFLISKITRHFTKCEEDKIDIPEGQSNNREANDNE